MEIGTYEKIGMGLVRKCGTRDPFEIAEGLGIKVRTACPDFEGLKGFYTVIDRCRFIFISDRLSEPMAKIVCAHEIGHDRLHREIVRRQKCMQEFSLYDMSSRYEYEANMVAASILLPDEEILDYIYHYRYDVETIARAMNSDINLVALKVAHLIERGYDLRGFEHNSKFLK